MNTKLTHDDAMRAQLDRLAAGDLPDNDRRSLLAWLDEDASRWRACSLAFLEAQTWEAATTAWPAAMKTPAAPKPPANAGRRGGETSWPRFLTLAAAAAVLFVAGHLSARIWRPAPPREVAAPSAPQSQGPLLASVPVRTNPSLPATLQIAVSPASGQTPPAPALSDYDRKQWERRGFDIQEELRYLPADLPDGTRVLVPVNKMKVKLKSNRVS